MSITENVQATTQWGAVPVFVCFGAEGGPYTVVSNANPLPASVSGGGSSNAAAGATGSAVPADADYAGLNVSGTLQGQTGVNPSGSIYAGQVDLASVGGHSVALGQAAMASSLPVAIASNQPAIPASQSGSWSVTVGAALPAGSNTIGGVNQAGTWTVQPGNTPNTTPWLFTINQGGNSATVTAANALKVDGSAVTQPVSGTLSINALPAGTNTIGNVIDVPATSGGLSTYRVLWPGNTTGVNVKASGGQVYGWYLFNNASSIRIVKLYNKATAPTTGTDTSFLTLVLPANLGANVFNTQGIAFSSGIGIAVTTGIADNDTGAPSANDVIVNLLYF